MWFHEKDPTYIGLRHFRCFVHLLTPRRVPVPFFVPGGWPYLNTHPCLPHFAVPLYLHPDLLRRSHGDIRQESGAADLVRVSECSHRALSGQYVEADQRGICSVADVSDNHRVQKH